MGKLKNFIFNNKLLIFTILLTFFLGIYVSFFAFKEVLSFSVMAENLGELKIYTIYHIETFEGGGKSRLTFLKNVAKQIEDENSGSLFIIKSIDPKNLKNELECEAPDIISFGFGVGKIVLPYLNSFDDAFSVRDELIESGSFNGKLYSIPYIISGYAEIKNEKVDKYFCGESEFISPRNVEISNSVTSWEPDSYSAYKKFVNTNNSALLGTARDVFRVNNLIELGRISATITPQKDYTDLIQYVGICKSSSIAKNFVSKLLNNENQMKLSEYSLFSTLFNTIYTSGIYSLMEKSIFECKVHNVYA